MMGCGTTLSAIDSLGYPNLMQQDPNEAGKHLTDQAFADMPIHSRLLAALQEQQLTHCTPIQAQTLPMALAGRSVAGQAETGTGKTAAFLIATLHHLLTTEDSPERKANQPRAIMIAPTRELAQQIHADAEPLCQALHLRSCVVYGGSGYQSQQDQIASGIDVLIGTPGRLIDYFKQHVFDLRAIEVAVLDEADRMFDLGFIKDIRFLMRRLPPAGQRLNLMFSATLSHKVMELAWEHLGDPEWVRSESTSLTARGIREQLYHVSKDDKRNLLINWLRAMRPQHTMIFVNTRRVAEYIDENLARAGIKGGMLSGNVPQTKRERLLSEFKSGEMHVLVATDVAARGLHIPGVSHVLNYDLPQDAEDYVHRIGRTARAGAQGDAVSFCCEEYVFGLEDIESLIGYQIPAEQPPADWLQRPELGPRPPRKPKPPRSGGQRRRSGGGGGGRRSQTGGRRS
jgi:ATP-dependent RNA helicase RhlB